MPVRRMRVEVYDETGNRYTIALEGKVNRKSALRILDIVELLGGMPGVGPEGDLQDAELTRIDKVRFVAERHFPLAWFSAKDLQSVYEDETKQPAVLSTISTYLSRLADRGLLMKAKNSNKVQYRVVSKDIKRLVRNP